MIFKKKVLFCSLLLFLSCTQNDIDPIVSTEEELLSETRTTQIKSVVDEMFETAKDSNANVPGIILGIWDNKTEQEYIYIVGTADKATDEKLTDNHHFKIASVTKTFVCNVVAQLIDEGKLSYSTPLSTYYPNLPNADRITIRMLGEMRSGYEDHLEDSLFLDNFDNLPNFTATIDEIINVSMSHDTLYSPDENFNYSNTNTVLLGQIVEQITGKKLETVLKERVFTPLGMNSSGAPNEGSYLPEPQAHSYHPNTLVDWTEKMDYSPVYACGNGYSTLMDTKRWVRSLATGELLSDSTFDNMFINGTGIPGATDYTYYFGSIDYRGFIGHSGDTDYYLTEAYHHPEKDLSVVVLSNTSLTGFTMVLFQSVVDILLDSESN